MLRSVLRDSAIYGVASILSKGIAIFLLPIYTKVLSPTDFGAYDLLVTLVALANLIVALEISQGLARCRADVEDDDSRVSLASTAFWFTGLMFGIACGATLLFSSQLTIFVLGDIAYLTAFQLGVCFIAVNGLYYLLLNQFRWELRSRAYAAVNFGYAMLTLLFAIIFCLILKMSLEGILLGQLLAATVCSLASYILLRKSFRIDFDVASLKQMLKFSLPLVPSGLAIFTSLYVSRFALNHFCTMEDVGVFGLASRVAGLATLLILGVQASLTPLVYQHFREAETPSHISRLFSWFVALALVACLSLALFAEPLIGLFSTQAYAAAAPLVAFLAPAMLLSQIYIFAPGIGIHKKTYWQLWVTLLSACASVGANLILVPIWGALGAAWATLFSSAVFLVGWFIASQRLYPIPYVWSALFGSVATYVALVYIGGVFASMNFSFIKAFFINSILLLLLVAAVMRWRLLTKADLHGGSTLLMKMWGRFRK